MKKTLWLSTATLALLLSVSPVQSAPVKLDGIAAIVDAKPILESDIQTRFLVIRDRIPGGALTADIERQILNQLVEEALQANYARKQGIQISRAEVDNAIMNMANKFGTDLTGFQQMLANQGIAYPRYRDQIEQEILINKAKQQVVRQRIAITEQEIDDYLATSQLASANDEYRLRHIVIRATNPTAAQAKIQQIAGKINNEQDFINQAIANSDGQFALQGGDLGWRPLNQLPRLFTEALQQSTGKLIGPLQSNAGFHLLWVSEKRTDKAALQTQTKVSHILLRPNEVRDDNATRTEIQAIYQRALTGEDFATLARDYSEDQGSTLQGGDLGWVAPGTMVPQFEQVMAQTQVGQIAAPFRTQFGWHILVVDGRRQQDISNQVERSQAEQALIAQKRDFVLDNWLSELRADAFLDVKQ
ncbi:peptidylprolyl isomerase [Maribrevibacterium harenarium]|uniref:Chaperone SurA n=1 Tax=Maribrevibacterium harenarium TaxID=2589817 RepID=A0A501X377_9GAMM|nr:peptidylprolyl isomerase [Maribrevibacterium harenarium]TPE54955.1 peptidylprolyl isomerase [Maribrevibacterium harenarium]